MFRAQFERRVNGDWTGFGLSCSHLGVYHACGAYLAAIGRICGDITHRVRT
jgi:hypothetical protein